MQILPAIQQIHPEIKMILEEDPVDLSSPIGKWTWMVVAGRLYLIDPDSKIYHHDNILALLQHYKKSIPDEDSV
jgi:hypothetical protein